jgi:RimJ/RimL family protein N-acetyltransferase
MRDYFLRSARLGFGTWSAEDLPLALGLWGDPEVTKLTGGPFTPAQVRERLSREIANHERHGIHYWPIFLLQTGHHPRNVGSKRLLEGFGFRYTHGEFYPPTGQVEPCYLLRNDDSSRIPRRDRS